MKHLSALAAISILTGTPAKGDAQPSSTVIDRVEQLVVKISAELEQGSSFGSGIVFAHGGDQLYIVTAYHVLHPNARTVRAVKVEFRALPGRSFPASILDQSDPGLDVAVLSVSGAGNIGKTLPFESSATVDTLDRIGARTEVYTIGNQNGKGWTVNLRPDLVAGQDGTFIEFQSSYVSGGDSGGALVNRNGDLVGMVRDNGATMARAIRVDVLRLRLQSLNYPMSLAPHRPSISEHAPPRASQPGPRTIHTDIFDFRLVACKALSGQVTCEVQVVNTTPEDRTLYVATRGLGGIASSALRELGTTALIGADGNVYLADAVRFANKTGEENGQSYFRVYANTKPSMRVSFGNVGMRVTAVRLDLVVGDTIQNHVTVFPVRFIDVPIQRQRAMRSTGPTLNARDDLSLVNANASASSIFARSGTYARRVNTS